MTIGVSPRLALGSGSRTGAECPDALDLDTARFEAELEDHVHLQCVQEHVASGRASHVRGTPGFFVNGVMVDTSFGLQALGDAIGASAT